jgi:hypothetical protein
MKPFLAILALFTLTLLFVNCRAPSVDEQEADRERILVERNVEKYNYCVKNCYPYHVNGFETNGRCICGINE